MINWFICNGTNGTVGTACVANNGVGEHESVQSTGRIAWNACVHLYTFPSACVRADGRVPCAMVLVPMCLFYTLLYRRYRLARLVGDLCGPGAMCSAVDRLCVWVF